MVTPIFSIGVDVVTLLDGRVRMKFLVKRSIPNGNAIGTGSVFDITLLLSLT